jgi:hypothetical protein
MACNKGEKFSTIIRSMSRRKDKNFPAPALQLKFSQNRFIGSFNQEEYTIPICPIHP